MRTPSGTAPPAEGRQPRRPAVTRGGAAAGEQATERDRTQSPGGRRVLDRYRLERYIGAGGFGVVWQAHDEKLERDVAVKVVPRDEGPREGSRGTREALAAARLNHPGIVALYELVSDERDVYLVSELVQGATLEELAREGALSDRDVARLGGVLCEALEHAHARGVVHRDVKPGNVMVLAEPAAGAGFAKLTDFGVAQLASGEGLTASGDVVGTLAYMAPEQAEGRRVTGACDLYALALTLYEAWTGENPVRAESPAATARRLGQPVPSLRSRRDDLPPGLCRAVDAALDPDPSYRPLPAELREALRQAEPALSDEGGLVEPETLERFGLTAVRARTKVRTLLHRAPRPPSPARAHDPPLPARRAYPDAPAAPGREAHPDDPRAPARARPRLLATAAPRVGAGLAAGSLVLAGIASLGPAPPFSPAAAAGGAALLVALLPRIGWICAALGVCAWLASPEAGRAGTALVLGAALAPVPLLLPRAGLLWSVPAFAPLAGALGLAPLFVGVAALVSSARWRAGLAAAGFVWLAVAEILSGHGLLYGAVAGTPARTSWEASANAAAVDALQPLVSSAALAPAALWAAFAFALPLLARGRWAALDLLVGVAWVVGLVAAQGALGDLLAPTAELDHARGVVAGTALAGVVALGATLITPRGRDGPHEPALP